MFSICRLRLHIHFPLILLVSNFFLVYSYQEKNFFHKYVNFVYESTHKLLTDHYGSLYKYKYDKLLMQEPSVASIKSPSILTYQESNNAQEELQSSHLRNGFNRLAISACIATASGAAGGCSPAGNCGVTPTYKFQDPTSIPLSQSSGCSTGGCCIGISCTVTPNPTFSGWCTNAPSTSFPSSYISYPHSSSSCPVGPAPTTVICVGFPTTSPTSIPNTASPVLSYSPSLPTVAPTSPAASTSLSCGLLNPPTAIVGYCTTSCAIGFSSIPYPTNSCPLSSPAATLCCAFSQKPTQTPSASPTLIPTFLPTWKPTLTPSLTPSATPSLVPTVCPTVEPSIMPSYMPSSEPSVKPTYPTVLPSFVPSMVPSSNPSVSPTISPSITPTVTPSSIPTNVPTLPSQTPTKVPTPSPSFEPSTLPTPFPSSIPTRPSSMPTVVPINFPSSIPSLNPSIGPSVSPSVSPTTCIPSSLPSYIPMIKPTSPPSLAPIGPSQLPIATPSQSPSYIPTSVPTVFPTTKPSMSPTISPSLAPTLIPSVEPSSTPSVLPSQSPTNAPSTTTPSTQPSKTPTILPSICPSILPSMIVPTTANPTLKPTIVPTAEPTSELPTFEPTVATTSYIPTQNPSPVPSSIPTSFLPTLTPTMIPITGSPTTNGPITTLPSIRPVSSQPFLGKVSTSNGVSTSSILLSSTTLSAVVIVSAIVCCAGFLVFIYIYTRFGINGRNRNLDADKALFVYDKESKSVIGDNIDGKIATASSDTTIAAGPKEGKPFETVNPFAGTNLFKMQKDRISNVVPTAPSPNFDSTNPHLRMSDAYRSKDGMSLKNPMTRPDMPQNSVSARVRLSALSPGKRAPGLGI